MPTNRVPLDRGGKRRITPQAVALYIKARAMYQAGEDEHWEDEIPSGRKQEYYDVCSALHDLLGLRPWHDTPVSVNLVRQRWDNPHTWAEVRQLHDLLEAAAAKVG